MPRTQVSRIKQARGFRQFLLRGFEKVRAEWAIVCTAHNLLKLVQRRSLSAALLAVTENTVEMTTAIYYLLVCY
jgi:hypothetical protein